MLSSMGVGSTKSSWGFTFFTLVPNTTEFMNAMSFAINGDVILKCVDFSPQFVWFRSPDGQYVESGGLYA